MAKEYLSSKSIPYQEFDVSRDKAALEEMVRLTGQMGVPVIVIDGEVVMGFDKTKIEGILSL
jgi:glutaredoxin